MARHPSNFFTGGGGVAITQLAERDNCIFSGNLASNFGGGIFNYFGRSRVQQHVHRQRSAKRRRHLHQGGLHVANTTFSGNRGYGGGIYNEGVANVFNSTFPAISHSSAQQSTTIQARRSPFSEITS